MPRDLKLVYEDTRSVTAPVPATNEDLAKIAEFLTTAANDGYTITGATEIATGQRDPLTVGLRINLQRTGPAVSA